MWGPWVLKNFLISRPQLWLMMAEVKMPAERMCASRGQGAALRSYPWILKKLS